MSSAAPTPLLNQVLETARSEEVERENDGVRKNAAAWEAEVNSVIADPASVGAILGRECPPIPGNDTRIWAWLNRIQYLSGLSRITNRLNAALLEAYLADVTPERRETVLNQLAVADRPDFFFTGPGWVSGKALGSLVGAPFLRQWILAVLEAYGDDGAVNDFWGVVYAVAEEWPGLALEIVKLGRVGGNDHAQSLRISLLGALRFRSNLPNAVATELDPLLGGMRHHPDPEERANYWRTLKYPLSVGRVPLAEMQRAYAAVGAATAAELAVGFELAVTSVTEKTADETVIAGLQWLREKAQPVTPPQQKLLAIAAVNRAIDRISPEAAGFDPADLLLQVQPIEAKYGGLWHRLQGALYPLAAVSLDRFHRLLRALARDHWPLLREVLGRNGPLAGTLSRMGMRTEDTAAFATALLASSEAGERRFGFFLVETLQLAGLPTGAKFTAHEFNTWLAEFQLADPHQTVAAQLVAAAARLDEADAAMIAEFQAEVLYQCKNLPGLCLEKLTKHEKSVPLLGSPLTTARQYFADLQRLQRSAIKAQHIPGLWRFRGRRARKERRQIQKSVEEHSIFAKLVQKSYLLYGTTWATYMAGKLGEEQTLATSSVSMEMPRKSTADPEEHLLRRAKATAFLHAAKAEPEEKVP